MILDTCNLIQEDESTLPAAPTIDGVVLDESDRRSHDARVRRAIMAAYRAGLWQGWIQGWYCHAEMKEP